MTMERADGKIFQLDERNTELLIISPDDILWVGRVFDSKKLNRQVYRAYVDYKFEETFLKDLPTLG